MEEDIKGKFVIRKRADGVRYALYVPENVNADTPVFTYVYGAGGPVNDWRNAQNGVLEHGSNSIIIMPNIDWNANWGAVTMDVVNEVKEEFGVTNTNVSSSGFSMGGFAGYVTVAENIKQNPDCEPQTVFLIDSYGQLYNNPNKYISDTDTINIYKENQTVFFAFDTTGKGTNVNEQYAKAGLNIITVKCVGQDHVGINAKFFSNGVYDYMAGGALPKDGYIYSKYNPETGKWEEIPYEEIATKDDLNTYFGIDTFVSNMDRLYKLPDITIKSDDKTLENYLNAIRKVLRNTTFFTANFNEASFLSTTQVPNAIPDLITEYFTMTSSLLNKIANKTTAIAKIAGEIELLDKNMSSRAEHINNATALYTIAEMIQQPIIDNVTDTPTENPDDVILTPPEELIPEEEKEETPTPPSNSEEQPTTPVQPSQPVIPPALPENDDDNDNGNGGQKPTEPTPPVQPSKPTEPEKLPIEEQFPKYDELYTSNDKVVYNYNDEYKVVVHHENGKITGVEHYYDYKTTEDATKAVEQLTKDYKDIENFDKIIQKDQYVKVMFKEDMYKE